MHQLGDAYRRPGIVQPERTLWRMIGATPMIGTNDVPGEVFTLEDARALIRFANLVDLGRISLWSANRDFQCGPNADDTRASNTCSGL